MACLRRSGYAQAGQTAGYATCGAEGQKTTFFEKIFGAFCE